MSSIIDTLKGFTNCTCYECTSGRDMNYVGDLDAYVCEECYRELSFDNAMDEQCVEIAFGILSGSIASTIDLITTTPPVVGNYYIPG